MLLVELLNVLRHQLAHAQSHKDHKDHNPISPSEEATQWVNSVHGLSTQGELTSWVAGGSSTRGAPCSGEWERPPQLQPSHRDWNLHNPQMLTSKGQFALTQSSRSYIKRNPYPLFPGMIPSLKKQNQLLSHDLVSGKDTQPSERGVAPEPNQCICLAFAAPVEI